MFAPTTQALLSTRKGLDVEFHRQRIDERLAELQAEMRALKIRRNSLSYAMDLPPEILSEIFLQVYLECQGRFPYYSGREERWIRIMHVCVHWRRVAFECAALWTTPTFSNPALTEFQLSRAGQAPLTVKYNACWANHRRFKTLGILPGVLYQPNRLRSVNIEKTQGERLNLPWLLEGCSSRAPYLESVRIRDNSLHPDFEIPSQFLAGGAPVLKSLELHGCRVTSWNALPFGPSLTSLKLSTEPTLSSDPTCPSWENLVQSLKQMPLLRTLHLADFIPLSDWSSPQYQSNQETLLSFTLQEVSTLELHYSTPAAIIQFLELSTFPNVSDLGFTFVQVETLKFLDSFFGKLRTSRGREFDPVQELQIRGSWDYESAIIPKCSPPSGPSAGLALRFRGPAVTPDGLVLAANKAFDLSPLSVLEVVDQGKLGAEVWTSVFSPLGMLQSVSIISATSVKEFSDALTTANSSNGFGALASLKLRRIDFREEDINLQHALQSRPESAPRVTLFVEEAYNFGEEELEKIADGAPDV